MTIEILTPISKLLAGQRLVPEQMRQNCLLLRFADPVPASLTSDFYRIHLTPDLLDGKLSEAEFYKAEIFQPSRSRKSLKQCRRCMQPMAQATVQYWKCQNRKCENVGRLVHSGPVRGVIDLRIQDDWIVDRKTIPVVLDGQATDVHGVPLTCTQVTVKACLLILDRRYDDIVLAAVYRTAGAICDQYGWKLK